MNRPAQNRNVLLYRVSEAARLLSISRSRAYELVAAGVIPSVKLGASVRVPALALERFVKVLQEEAGGAYLQPESEGSKGNGLEAGYGRGSEL